MPPASACVPPLRCFSLTNEVVLLHRPSRTLVVTDLVFNFTADYPWLTRAAMFSSGAYPGCQASMLERVGMDRGIAREEIAGLLALDKWCEREGVDLSTWDVYSRVGVPVPPPPVLGMEEEGGDAPSQQRGPLSFWPFG